MAGTHAEQGNAYMCVETSGCALTHILMPWDEYSGYVLVGRERVLIPLSPYILLVYRWRSPGSQDP